MCNTYSDRNSIIQTKDIKSLSGVIAEVEKYCSNGKFYSIIENTINSSYAQFYIYKSYQSRLQNGIAQLTTTEELDAYLAYYGEMHYIKLESALEELCNAVDLNEKNIEIIDWGCGQAFASCVMTDILEAKSIKTNIEKFHLIEPSMAALHRGTDFLQGLWPDIQKSTINCINKQINEVQSSDFNIESKNIKIHLFSNILDIQTVNIALLNHTLKYNFRGENLFVCVGSSYNSDRITEFSKSNPKKHTFDNKNDILRHKIYSPIKNKYVNYSITRRHIIFKSIF